MSGKSRSIHLTWLGKNLLALTGGDLTIRLWDCQSNDTYVLPLPDMAEISFHSGAEHFTTLAYQKSFLAAATNLGGIAFWRCGGKNSDLASNNPEEDWQFVGLLGLSGNSMDYSAWGSGLLYVHTGSTLYQIVQQQPFVVFKNEVHFIVRISNHRSYPIPSFFCVNLDWNCANLLVCSIDPKGQKLGQHRSAHQDLRDGLVRHQFRRLGRGQCGHLSAEHWRNE